MPTETYQEGLTLRLHQGSTGPWTGTIDEYPTVVSQGSTPEIACQRAFQALELVQRQAPGPVELPPSVTECSVTENVQRLRVELANLKLQLGTPSKSVGLSITVPTQAVVLLLGLAVLALLWRLIP